MAIFGYMLAALAAALAALAIVGAFQGVMTNQRTQTVLNTMTVIESTVRRSFANRPQFEGGGALQGVSVSAVPTTAIRGTGTGREIVTPWGANITTGAGTTIGTDTAHNTSFWILVSDVPEEACETIGAAHLDRSDVIGVDADGTWAAMTATVAGAHDTVAEINASCNGGDDDDVGIVFRG